MTIEEQQGIIQYLLNSENSQFALNNIEHISDDTFESPHHKVVISIVKSYRKKYDQLPTKNNLVIHLDDQRSSTKHLEDPAIYNSIRKVIDIVYSPLPADINILEDRIVTYVRSKHLKKVLTKAAGDGSIDTDKGQKSIKQDIASAFNIGNAIGGAEWEDHNSSGFLIQEGIKNDDILVPKGNSIGYKGWDMLTAAHGFLSPQLIVLMSGPKRFKTGLCINVAKNYVESGLKVYYADFDNNGKQELRNRFYQSIIGVGVKDLKKSKKSIEYNTRIYKDLGGDIIFECFQSEIDSTATVEERLDYLAMWHGWVPDVIVWDYPFKMAPTVKPSDKRINIQKVFVDIQNLQSRRRVFGFAPSQTNGAAIKKDKFTLMAGDIAEDIAQIANAQAIFAWNRTQEELKRGLGRITPVEQRQGAKFGTVFFKVDEANMWMEEITRDEYIELYPQVTEHLGLSA